MAANPLPVSAGPIAAAAAAAAAAQIARLAAVKQRAAAALQHVDVCLDLLKPEAPAGAHPRVVQSLWLHTEWVSTASAVVHAPGAQDAAP